MRVLPQREDLRRVRQRFARICLDPCTRAEYLNKKNKQNKTKEGGTFFLTSGLPFALIAFGFSSGWGSICHLPSTGQRQSTSQTFYNQTTRAWPTQQNSVERRLRRGMKREWRAGFSWLSETNMPLQDFWTCPTHKNWVEFMLATEQKEKLSFILRFDLSFRGNLSNVKFLRKTLFSLAKRWQIEKTADCKRVVWNIRWEVSLTYVRWTYFFPVRVQMYLDSAELVPVPPLRLVPCHLSIKPWPSRVCNNQWKWLNRIWNESETIGLWRNKRSN